MGFSTSAGFKFMAGHLRRIDDGENCGLGGAGSFAQAVTIWVSSGLEGIEFRESIWESSFDFPLKYGGERGIRTPHIAPENKGNLSGDTQGDTQIPVNFGPDLPKWSLPGRNYPRRSRPPSSPLSARQRLHRTTGHEQSKSVNVWAGHDRHAQRLVPAVTSPTHSWQDITFIL